MRVIKFRYILKHKASGNIETKFYSLAQIEQRSLKELSPVFHADYEELGCSQLTGRKDKKGNLIYEDDILKWNEKEWGEPFNELVKWDYEQFSMRESDWPQWCEVIGNKFENPELLENPGK